ncbi:MAG: (E)-4-hydroxy-3-methylbut-2-enyl-diphosphate synthase [Cyclobacteriaceae bacterium]
MDQTLQNTQDIDLSYCTSLTSYSRRKTRVVKVGGVAIGGDNPIRVQSMTTVDTMDTEGSVEECIRMIDSGCEIIRITAPSIKEAANLANIKQELRDKGYKTPLVADIHFTPNAAEVAAKIVEKVRVNPGNYADKKKFDVIEYTDESYAEELDRIREKFVPLVTICKEHGTAMRIGTNHGSLSDRIMSRYGDTPLGMVESALEFIRICEDENYHDIVISMKSSNTRVMVQAYRLLVAKLEEEGLQPYPLHLGVTEAGEAEDGRIKSAVGIGTLLEDGLGDTVRVSLTEAPEYEAPVARKLIQRYQNRVEHQIIPSAKSTLVNPYLYARRKTKAVENIGGDQVPRVIADISTEKEITKDTLQQIGYFYNELLDKWSMTDLGADYVYTGQLETPFMLPNGLQQVIDSSVWKENSSAHPLFTKTEWETSSVRSPKLNFLQLQCIDCFDTDFLQGIQKEKNLVLILETENAHAMPAMRRAFFELIQHNIQLPIIIKQGYSNNDKEQLLIDASTDVGGLLIDGLGDGVCLMANTLDRQSLTFSNETAFGILQAARTRMTKTEYISCPSCGRTLFDLQETTAMIRKHTDHLKGIKIGIMGCIVNGPGEMADADYGYVGSGKGKITLYKGQEVMKKSVPSEKALDELIAIIREDGKWTEPTISEDF